MQAWKLKVLIFQILPQQLMPMLLPAVGGGPGGLVAVTPLSFITKYDLPWISWRPDCLTWGVSFDDGPSLYSMS